MRGASTAGAGDVSDDASTSTSANHHAPSAYGKLMQSVNTAGIALFFKSSLTDRTLAMPQVSCETIANVNWAHLRALGFVGVVFDKDNTLTTPYALEIHGEVRESLERCKSAFGSENVAVYSNSAGLTQYDPDGAEADAMERALGIRFIRHATKKPAGDVKDVVAHFTGCDSARKLIFVGDRYLTDVVYGNRHGMFTIRVAPFTTKGESLSIKSARAIEQSVVALWGKLGVSPAPHERLFGPHHAAGASEDPRSRWRLIQGEPAFDNLAKITFV
jgi:phosphatidylglycerophosphatase GEP4